MFTLQENSILNVQAREERLETGYLDELDRSSARENLADITYISPCSSVEDNFDDVFCVNEATTYSATEQSDIEHKKLSEKEVVQGCELPFKIRRSHAFRRKVNAINESINPKRKLTSDSSGASTVASGNDSSGAKGGPAPEKRAKNNGTTPPSKQPKDNKKDSEKEKERDRRRKEKKDKEDKEWAEVVKNTMKVDVKSSNGAKLTQADFSRINERCNLVMMQLNIEGGDNWRIGKQGVAQYGLYYRVFNQQTVDTMKVVIPKIDPKCKRIPNADYTYQVYGPGECKKFILRWRINVDFQDWEVETLNNVMHHMNKDLWEKKVLDESTNTMRDGVVNVLGPDAGNDAKKREKELLNKEPGKGNITILVEFEDILWDALIEVKKGRLSLGTNGGDLLGFDIQEHVKLFLAGKERPRRPNEFRGDIKDTKEADREAEKAAKDAGAIPLPDDEDDLLNQED